MLLSVRTLTSVIWNHPANRGWRIRALAKSAGWQLYKRTIAKPFDVDAFGYRLRCYPDSHDASRMIYFNGLPDPAEMTFIRRYIRPGDRVIDAGANIGVYSLFLASLVGPEGFVLSFEPDPANAARLRENVARNGLANVEVRQIAVADSVGKVAFSQGADTGNTLYKLKGFSNPPRMVDVSTLDRELQGSFTLCKMDIEGAEPDALLGAVANLAKANPPVWLMELSEKCLARSNRTIADVEATLSPHGYRLWRYRDGELVPFVMEARAPGQVGDGIAIADAAMDEVRHRLSSDQSITGSRM